MKKNKKKKYVRNQHKNLSEGEKNKKRKYAREQYRNVF